MRRPLLAAAVVGLIGAALVGARASDAIVGGTAIQVQAAPWVVYVQYQAGPSLYYRCTGSVIDDLHIVTAAHCLYSDGGALAQPADLLVDAGLSNFFGPTGTDAPQSLGVVSFRIHPGFKYTGSSMPDDVAVLTLESPLDLSGAATKAIALPAPGRQSTGELTVAGFGRETPSQTASGPLNSTAVSASAQGQCGKYTSIELIADDNATIGCFTSSTAGVCNGDSGAGISTSGSSPVLVGVVFASDASCGAGTPAFAVDVAAPEILSFIQGSDTPPSAPRVSGVYRLAFKAPLTVGEAVACVGTASPASSSTTYSFADVTAGRTLQSGARASYLVPAPLAGHKIRCLARVTNAGGTAVAQTAASPAVKAKPKPRKKKH